MKFASRIIVRACVILLRLGQVAAFSKPLLKTNSLQSGTSAHYFKPLPSVQYESFSKMSLHSQIDSETNDEKIPNQSGLKNKFNLELDRRSVLSSIGVTAAISSTWTLNPLESYAEQMINNNPVQVDAALTGENGLLESRLTENLMSPPTYGLEDSDIFYPSYFAGVWDASSVATEVYAPCGIALFGGNATYESAQKEIGVENALKYRSRFLPDRRSSESIAIADREFNVREIAKAAMGKNSVQDVSLATPNKFSCLLSPAGSGGKLFTVNMISVARRQELKSVSDFDCSEVVRQIISPYNSNGAGNGIPSSNPGSASNLKEIETISAYNIGKRDPDTGKVTEIKCVQRSATFLVPSQTDPMAYRKWQAARGRPVDVRFYEVTYTKV